MGNEYTERDLHAEQGLFISRFEQMCYWIRVNIQTLSFPEGAHGVSQVCEILLEGMTAEPLVKKFGALVLHVYTDDALTKKVIKKMTDFIKDKVIPVRNSLTHGVARYNFDPATMGSRNLSHREFSLTHPKIKSAGFDVGHKIVTIDNLRYLNEILETLGTCLVHTSFAFDNKEPLPLKFANSILDFLQSCEFSLES